MDYTAETSFNGTVERRFALDGVPGVHWAPAAGSQEAPVILLAHGGGQHKKAPGIVARAHRFVRLGWSAVSLDAPGHGDRPRSAQDEDFAADLRRRLAAGEPVSEQVHRQNAGVVAAAVPEWRAVLDDLDPRGPVGFWGLSLGSAVGVQLVGSEPRIAAAVLGLIGIEGLEQAAPGVRVPVEFLLQWDDELVVRDSCLALFDALGSTDKTLHANPGGHVAVPRFEVDSAERFFARHLV